MATNSQYLNGQLMSLASNWMSMSDLDFIRVQGFYNVFQKVTYLKTFLYHPKIIYKIIKYCLLRNYWLCINNLLYGDGKTRNKTWRLCTLYTKFTYVICIKNN
jgi:hypothetical protein